MCSCSGSCNCNSTTIPKGPAGPQGPQGIQGIAGYSGTDGNDGIDGINSFTTLIASFQQPQAANNPAIPTTINVANTAWIAIDQIIYISGTTSSQPGGYYRVLGKNMNGDLTAVSVIRLNWLVAGVNFVVNPNSVLSGSSVTPAGTKGVDGTNGSSVTGPQGVNAYTIVQQTFYQPAINGSPQTIVVANNTWIGIGQILYISSASLGIGGFYQVNTKTGTNNITATRLDWLLPNLTFINNGDQVYAGSTVSAAGPQGVAGDTDGLSYLQDAFWGIKTTGGVSDKSLSTILVPLNTLITNGDVLECQTIYRTQGLLETDPGNSYYVKICNATAIAGAVGPVVALSNYFPDGGISPYIYIFMNYKIQKTGINTFRCKSEIFCSDNISSLAFTNVQIAASFINLSTSDMTLNSTSTWGMNQYIVASADDPSSAPGKTILMHHEVKVVKKSI